MRNLRSTTATRDGDTGMYKLLMKLLAGLERPAPVYECGYAYPHHSATVHYHAGHPRKKRQEFRPGIGPYDGEKRFANTGVPKNPNGETYANLTSR